MNKNSQQLLQVQVWAVLGIYQSQFVTYTNYK